LRGGIDELFADGRPLPEILEDNELQTHLTIERQTKNTQQPRPHIWVGD
jgi:hypothetical protein